jgi:hypothetical protein
LIPVPLPPPACRCLGVLRANSLAIEPAAAAISNLSSGLPTGRTATLFSGRPVSLRTSGPHPLGTVLEIRSFRVTYEPQRKVVRPFLSDRRERPISMIGFQFTISRFESSRPRQACGAWRQRVFRVGICSQILGTVFRGRTRCTVRTSVLHCFNRPQSRTELTTIAACDLCASRTQAPRSRTPRKIAT